MKQFTKILANLFMLSVAGGNVGQELGNTWAGLWASLFVAFVLLMWADMYAAILKGKY